MEELEDHDQRLKTMIAAFLGELFELFFPPWAERLDVPAAEWIEKEVFADPPEGRRRTLDLLARVPIRSSDMVRPDDPAELLSLVHLELETAERTTVAKRQLWENYSHLRTKHRLPVLPMAIYFNVGLEGIGQDEHTETFGDLEVLRFRYLYVGLRRLDALEYVEGPNLLGVALTPFMRMDPSVAVQIGGRALERIADSSLDEHRKFLLAECVEAYLPLTPEQQDQFEELRGSPNFRGLKAMNVTTREKGYREGMLDLLTRELERRFGKLSDEVLEKIGAKSIAELRELSDKIHQNDSLNELGIDN